MAWQPHCDLVTVRIADVLDGNVVRVVEPDPYPDIPTAQAECDRRNGEDGAAPDSVAR